MKRLESKTRGGLGKRRMGKPGTARRGPVRPAPVTAPPLNVTLGKVEPRITFTDG